MIRYASYIVVATVVAVAHATAQLKFSESVNGNIIIPGNSIACNATGSGVHFDNSYIRFYNPFTEGETAPILTITEIRYGVESAIAGSGQTTQPIFLNLYSAPTGNTGFAGWTLLHQEPVNQPNVTIPAFFTQPLSGILIQWPEGALFMSFSAVKAAVASMEMPLRAARSA